MGIHLKRIHGPRSASSLISVVVPAVLATDTAVAATAASLLSSACQDFTVDIVGVPEAALLRTRDWLSSDTRFKWISDSSGTPRTSTFTLVLPAGARVGTFSLEALVDAKLDTGATLIRALLDGGNNGAAEFWDTQALSSLAASGDPENAVRASGKERWVSGSSLGLHDYRQPAPKMHLRKGSAGRHDLTILVRDAADSDVKADYERRIRQLEAKLAKAQTERRLLEAGVVPKRGIARIAAVARRGPAYMTARARAILVRMPNK